MTGIKLVRLITTVTILGGSIKPVLASLALASYAEGKQFLVEVHDEDLIKAPVWNSKAANPPLSARRAIQLATEVRRTLVKDTRDAKWEIVQAELVFDRTVDRWFWVVAFQPHNQPDPRILPNLRLAVLMDGTVVQPKIKRLK